MVPAHLKIRRAVSVRDCNKVLRIFFVLFCFVGLFVSFVDRMPSLSYNTTQKLLRRGDTADHTDLTDCLHKSLRTMDISG